MGNKSRFLDAIETAVDEVAHAGSTACDLFAGTAVVTRRLARKRPVVSADIQAYSRVLASALTEPRVFSALEIRSLLALAREWIGATQPLFRDLLHLEERALADVGTNPAPLAELIELGSLAVAGGCGPLESAKARARDALDPESSALAWYYGGVYFSYRQSIEMDALRYAIRVRGGQDRDCTAIAALLGVASDVVATVGNHFAQPVRPRRGDGTLKRSWIPSVLRSRNVSVFHGFERWLGRYALLEPTKYRCTALQADYQETLSTLGPDVGVIYADPPYTRDHYSRFYHVLETIVLDDDPGVSPGQGTSQPSRGLYRQNRHQSPFSTRSQVRPAFHELFSHAKRLDVPLVLSYSPMSAGTRARPETRLMSVHDLKDLAGDYFADVGMIDVASSSHSRFNRTELNAAIAGSAEVLIIGRN